MGHGEEENGVGSRGRKGRRKRGKEKMFEIVLIFEEARRWPIIHLRILSFSSIS